LIDALSEHSDGQRARRARVVGLALVMIAFVAIGVVAYSAYAKGAESAGSGVGQGGASTLIRASTLTVEPAAPAATTVPPVLVETEHVAPDAAPRADRIAPRGGARINRDRERKTQATALRYWRATTAEPDVGF